MESQFQNEMNALLAQIPPRQRGKVEELAKLTKTVSQQLEHMRQRLSIFQAFFYEIRVKTADYGQKLKEHDAQFLEK